jgi:hypothetical protein
LLTAFPLRFPGSDRAQREAFTSGFNFRFDFKVNIFNGVNGLAGGWYRFAGRFGSEPPAAEPDVTRYARSHKQQPGERDEKTNH